MDWKQLILLLVLAGLLLLVMKFGKHKGENSRSAKLMKRYGHLTPEQLAAAPEEEQVEAVVSYVLAQAAQSRRPDPVRVLSDKPHGFAVVYSLWAVCKELAAGSYGELMHTATREVVEMAQSGFADIGAAETAQAFTALRDAYAGEQDTEAAEHAFHVAVEKECPLTLCVAYIRDNPEQFGAAPAQADALPQSEAEDTASENV